MSKLNIDQQTIKELFENKKSDFLIPDYQRPYAWGEDECQTLWDDIFTFAFPDNDYSKFDKDNDEYFLGPIVTFKNGNGKLEIIDGQQRLTTLMLLLRAFYSRFKNMQDANSKNTREVIAKCIWKTDEFGNADTNLLKIDSEVSTDEDKEEFLSILKTGTVNEKQKSKYAVTYRLFETKINEFLEQYPSYFAYLPTRILNNCILLPIEAESQDTALRIFSTLNDRGKPLSDADIFKAQLYKFYSGKGEKDQFIKRWRSLEEICGKIFNPASGTPLDELFTRYMYYERAVQGIKSTTTEALRKFYEKNKYAILKRDKTMFDLEALASFWNDVSNQDKDTFSERVLRKLFVLNYAPNGMWAFLLSVFYMQNKNDEGKLDDDALYMFLDKITAFIFSYALLHPGVNALRLPAYPEMISIVNGEPVSFSDYKFGENELRNVLSTYEFTNGRPITKSMLAWWAFRDDSQPLWKLDTKLEIEHIFARKRQEVENSLTDKRNLESLGNKALLEKDINIRAADYRFADKKKYYEGYVNDKGRKKDGTINRELLDMSKTATDFTEADIINRKADFIDAFVQYVKDNDLII